MKLCKPLACVELFMLGRELGTGFGASGSPSEASPAWGRSSVSRREPCESGDTPALSSQHDFRVHRTSRWTRPSIPALSASVFEFFYNPPQPS